MRREFLAHWESAIVVRVSEVYASIQGEGQFSGTPSLFVRATGCNLRCWFCDTPFTSWEPEGQTRSVSELLQEVAEFGLEHVVVTGGEPLLQPDCVELCARLKSGGHFLTIETAGTVFRPAPAHLMSISPKLKNSSPARRAVADATRWVARHDQIRTNRSVIERLIASAPYQFKFVIDQPNDLRDVGEYLTDWPQIPRDCVWLMPQARTREELAQRSGWVEAEAKRLGYRFSSRWQIAQFGNERGR